MSLGDAVALRGPARGAAGASRRHARHDPPRREAGPRTGPAELPGPEPRAGAARRPSGKFGKPDALFAPDRASPRATSARRTTTSARSPRSSRRRSGSACPSIPLGAREPGALEDELLGPQHAGQLLFIAWEHNLAVQLARTSWRRGGDPKQVRIGTVATSTASTCWACRTAGRLLSGSTMKGWTGRARFARDRNEAGRGGAPASSAILGRALLASVVCGCAAPSRRCRARRSSASPRSTPPSTTRSP